MAEQTTIPEGEARTQTDQAVPSAGPFAIPWPFFSLDDVVVTLTDADGIVWTKLRGVDYDIEATANGDGIYPSGAITFSVEVVGVVTRYRATSIERLSNLPTNGFLDRVSLNADLNRGMAAAQDLDARQNRALAADPSDTVRMQVLPIARVRANKVLSFDSGGQPIVTFPSGGGGPSEGYSVLEFDAVGDGVTDDTEALQRAIETASQHKTSLFVPPVDIDAGRFYRITRRLVQLDDTLIWGRGRGSRIVNTRTNSDVAGDMSVFTWGQYSGSALSPLNPESETFYACEDIVVPTHTVVLSTPADAANFTPGRVVFLRNSTALDDQIIPGTGLPVHFELMSLNEVVEADPDTGEVLLLYPIDDPGSGMMMAQSGNAGLVDELGYPIRIRKNVGLMDLSLGCHWNQGKGCFIWGGAFKFLLKGLYLDGPDALSLQCMSRGRVQDIDASIGSKIWDASMYTSHVEIDNVRRTPRPGDSWIAPHGPEETIASGNYDDDTGLVELTMDEEINPNAIFADGFIRVTNLTGSGALAKLQGTTRVLFAEDFTIRFEATGGLGAISIDGGIVRAAVPDELCIIGQAVHDLKIRRLTIDAGELDRTCLRIGRARRCTLEEIEVIGRACKGLNRPVILGGTSRFGPDGIEINGLVVRTSEESSPSPWSAVNIKGYDGVATPREWNVLRGLQVYGAPNYGLKIDGNALKWRVVDPLMPGLPLRNDSTDPGNVVILGGLTRHTNHAVHEGLLETLSVKGAETLARSYAIGAHGAGEKGGWVFRIGGVATTAGGAADRFLALYLDSTEICRLDLATGMTDTPWAIEARVGMRGAHNLQSAVSLLGIGSSLAAVVAALGAVSTSTAKSFSLTYKLDPTDTGIVLYGFDVEPYGHESM